MIESLHQSVISSSVSVPLNIAYAKSPFSPNMYSTKEELQRNKNPYDQFSKLFPREQYLGDVNTSKIMSEKFNINKVDQYIQRLTKMQGLGAK